MDVGELVVERAVAAMQQRPVSDVTSWAYQAAIHGTTRRSRRRSWNSCEHGGWYFFPWHRAYLAGFERIVRAEVVKQAGPAADGEELVRRAYREVFARSPSAAELRFSRAYLAESAARDTEGGSESQESRIAALGALCQALLCSSQFQYLD